MSATSNVTVASVIREQCWKDNGTNFIRLRITFQRKSRFLTTNILIRREQVGRGGKIKDPDIRYKVEELVRLMETRLSALDYPTLQAMSFDHLIKYLQAEEKDPEKFRLDFYEFAESVIDAKKGQSQKTYRSALNSFKTYYGKSSMDISLLTSSLMRAWEKWLRDKYGDSARCVSAYPACISFIHGQARLKYNNEETGEILIRNPFQFYKPPRQKQAKHRDVDASLLQRMIDLRETLTGRERLGVDVFLISFALMGMNAPDLYDCEAPKQDILHYFRTKTRSRRDDNAEMFVQICPVVRHIMEEYKATDRKFAFNFRERYTSYSIFGANVNKGLEKFRQRIDYGEKITLYGARHSWASTAYEAGVDKSLINDGLCHVDKAMKVTDIYINKDWSVLWEANEKVLKQFRWSKEETSATVPMTKKRMTSKQIILFGAAGASQRQQRS